MFRQKQSAPNIKEKVNGKRSQNYPGNGRPGQNENALGEKGVTNNGDSISTSSISDAAAGKKVASVATASCRARNIQPPITSVHAEKCLPCIQTRRRCGVSNCVCIMWRVQIMLQGVAMKFVSMEGVTPEIFPANI
jgi:hypothetical protein